MREGSLSRCLVTGGSGFVGTALAQRLVDDGSEVTVFDLNPPAVELRGSGTVQFVRGDVRDVDALTDASRGADCCFHLAAMVPLTRAGEAFQQVNAQGVRNVVEACVREGVPQLVHLSSSAIYGVPRSCPVREDTTPRPFGLYGPAKLEGERIALRGRARGLNVAVIRPRTVIGPGRLGIFDLLYEWIRAGSPIFLLGSADRTFQLVSNRDLTEAMMAAGQRRADGEYNVGAERYTTLRQDLNALARTVGSSSRVRSVPTWLGRPGLRLLDAARLSPLVDWHYRTIDKEFWFDNVRPREELGWQPVDSNLEMLHESYRWHLEHRSGIRGADRSAHRSPLKRGLLGLTCGLAGALLPKQVDRGPDAT